MAASRLIAKAARSCALAFSVGWGSAAAADPVLERTQLELPVRPPGEQGLKVPLPSKPRYEVGSEGEVEVILRANPDLDRRVRDDFLILHPEFKASITYTPVDWLEGTFELQWEYDIMREEDRIVLPDGEVRLPEKTHPSLLVEKAFISVKQIIDPFELRLGRQKFRDERRWLYDKALDALLLRYRHGLFQGEASVSREDAADLDLLRQVPKGRVNNYLAYGEYLGLPNNRLAAYTLLRHDSGDGEGRPLYWGLRAYGAPSKALSYWGELASLRGSDELGRRFEAHALDLGATYRFTGHPWVPNLTLGYAFGSGDGDDEDNVNREFRQTGWQKNEARFAGHSRFKYYGEALDPELSNLEVLTLGIGAVPSPELSIDLVYHRYRLHRPAEEFRDSELTALMNQVDGPPSRDVGAALDVVFGFRNLFGHKHLALDLRAGWFFPGRAFRRNVGDDDNPDIRDAEKAFAVAAKLVLW